MVEQRRTVSVRVSGRVQGVSFRYWTLRQAQALGLAGWVRNEADGSVRALIAGPAAAVEEMLARLKEGPPAARVDRVEVEPAAAVDVPRKFEIRR